MVSTVCQTFFSSLCPQPELLSIPHLSAHGANESFEMLLQKFTSPPTLAYADYNKLFVINTDASGSGLSTVLYQEQDGAERVVTYACRGLRKKEINNPAHKLEFLALKWAVVDKIRDYLYGNQFLVRTDNNNTLTYVSYFAKLDATSHRW